MNLHLREEFIKNVRGDIWKKIATGIGFAAFILLFAGIPLGGAMMQGFANLKDTGHIIAPKAAPTPLVLSPEIAQSVSQYLAANWQGWEFAGYDNESSVINYDEKDFRPTVILTKDTHRLRVNLRLIPATKDNVTTWETISDVPVTEGDE